MDKVKAIYRKITDNPVNTFLFLMLTLFPLVYHDFYFDITITKYRVMQVLVFCMFMAGLAMADRTRQHNNRLRKRNHTIIKKQSFKERMTSLIYGLNLLDVLMIMFLIVNIISCIGSEWRKEAFTGSACNNTGLVYIAFMVLMYWVISRYAVLNQYIRLSFPVILIIVSVFSVVQYCGFNPLGFYDNIKANQRHMFMATFGNINVYSAFLCVYLPICIYMFCHQTGKLMALYGASVFLGFLGCFACNSDSVYLGIGAAFAALFIAATRRVGLLKRYGILLAVLSLSLIAYNILEKIFAATTWEPSTLNNIISSNIVITALVVLAAVIIIIAVFLQKKNYDRLTNITSYIFVGLLAAFIIAAVAVVVYFSVYDKTTDLGNMGRYLRFNLQWGTGRGRFWIWMVEIFAISSPFIKMFGSGAATFGLLCFKYYEPEINVKYNGAYGSSVHNEYLTYLMTNGMFGLLIYAAMLVIALRKAVLKAADEPFMGAIALGIIGYAVMALVNINQCIVGPFIWILMAFAGTRSTE